MNYYASVGYLRDGGAVANSRYERYTALTNIDYQAKKWLKLNTNMGFTQNISQTPSYSDTYGSSGKLRASSYAGTGAKKLLLSSDNDAFVLSVNQIRKIDISRNSSPDSVKK